MAVQLLKVLTWKTMVVVELQDLTGKENSSHSISSPQVLSMAEGSLNSLLLTLRELDGMPQITPMLSLTILVKDKDAVLSNTLVILMLLYLHLKNSVLETEENALKLAVEVDSARVTSVVIVADLQLHKLNMIVKIQMVFITHHSLQSKSMVEDLEANALVEISRLQAVYPRVPTASNLTVLVLEQIQL